LFVWLRFYDVEIAIGLLMLAMGWSALVPMLIQRRFYQYAAVVCATSGIDRVVLTAKPEVLHYADHDTNKEWPWSRVPCWIRHHDWFFLDFNDANVIIVPASQLDPERRKEFFRAMSAYREIHTK